MEPMDVDLDYQSDAEFRQWASIPNGQRTTNSTSSDALWEVDRTNIFQNAQKIQPNSHIQNSQHSRPSQLSSSVNFQQFENVLVIDTNILLSQLTAFKDLVNRPERFHICQVIIPYVVLDELDYQKTNGRPENKTEAQNAIRFVNQQTANSCNVIMSSMFPSLSSSMVVDDENGVDDMQDGSKGDKFFMIEKHRHDVLKDIGDGRANDDKILAVCIQRHEELKQASTICSFTHPCQAQKKRVIFLTNDMNLQNKASAHSIVAKSLADYRMDFLAKTYDMNSSPGPKKKWIYGNSISSVSVSHFSSESLHAQDRWSS